MTKQEAIEVIIAIMYKHHISTKDIIKQCEKDLGFIKTK